MSDIVSRLGAVNPLIWVAIIVAAVLSFGAQKWVRLLKVPEEKQMTVVIIMKVSALAIAALLFVLVISTK